VRRAGRQKGAAGFRTSTACSAATISNRHQSRTKQQARHAVFAALTAGTLCWKATAAVVHDFVGMSRTNDKRITKFFAKSDIARLELRLVKPICQGSGGLYAYQRRGMKDGA
jgi:hypothetical protein